MNGVIVFVKNPELGKVKTRLASTLGDIKALEIYNKLVGYTRSVLSNTLNVNRLVFYSSFVDMADEWNNDTYIKKLQSGDDLGERMSNAFELTLQDCNKVLIIGSDCSQLKPTHIEEAFQLLNDHNVVIGPSMDGGYYLLGMDAYYPELFADMEWSTESVLDETLSRANSSNLSYAKLEELSDIDYEEDWDKYGF